MSSDADPVMNEAPAGRWRGAFMERHVGHLLRRAYAHAKQNSAAALARLGDVSPIQAAAMTALMDGALTQAELSRRIEMKPANTHGLVKRLVAGGLAVTMPSPTNRRLSLVALSPDGETLAAGLEQALAAASRATLDPLDDNERRLLIGLLQRIALDQD